MANRAPDAPIKYGITADQIRNDLTAEIPQWIFSCYAPGKDAPEQLFGGYPREQSFEELRLHYMTGVQAGNEQGVRNEIEQLYASAKEQIQNTLSNVDGAVNFIVSGENKHPNRHDVCKQGGTATGLFGVGKVSMPDSANPFLSTNNTTNNNSTASAFGQPSALGQRPSPFGAPAFGQPSQPQPAFGQPSQPQSTFGQPSQPQPAFGQPSQPQSAFGQPSQPQSAFGQPSQPQPAFGQPSQPQSAFGQPSQPRSAFGQPSQPQSAFGQPSQPQAAFGQPSQPSSALARPSQPQFGQSAFGQPSQPQASFGQPSGLGARPSPFAQSQPGGGASFGQPSALGAKPNPFSGFANNNSASPSPFAQSAANSGPSPFAQSSGGAAAPSPFAAAANNPSPFAQSSQGLNGATPSPFASAGGNPTPSPFASTTQQNTPSPFASSQPQSFGAPDPPKPSPFAPTNNQQAAPNPFARQPATTTQQQPNHFSSGPHQQGAGAGAANGAANGAGSGPYPPGSTRTHPPLQSYSSRLPNGQLGQWKGKPVVYKDNEPGIQDFTGGWIRIWFPNGPPAYLKDTEVPDGEYGPEQTAQWEPFMRTGKFDGRMPDVAPMREFCTWDF